MDKFGKEPFRSVESLGVSGILGRKGEILYFPFFETRHLGRTCDLIAAHFRPSGINEFHLRNVIDQSVSLAFSAQNYSGDSVFGMFAEGSSSASKEPVYLECGVDLEKLIVSVTFHVSDQLQINWERLSENIHQRRCVSEFEKAISRLHSYSDRLLIKYVLVENMAEIVAFLALPGRIAESELGRDQPLKVLFLEPAKLKDSLGEERYLNPGDLEYQRLLQRDAKQESASPKRKKFQLLDRSSWSWNPWASPKSSDEPLNRSGNEKVGKKPREAESSSTLAELAEKDKLIRELEVKIDELSSIQKMEQPNGKNSSSLAAEYSVLKVRYSQLAKKFEDLKAKNQSLMAQIRSLSKGNHRS